MSESEKVPPVVWRLRSDLAKAADTIADLVAVLRSAVSDAEAFGIFCEVAGGTPNIPDWVAPAKTAIAKAEGR